VIRFLQQEFGKSLAEAVSASDEYHAADGVNLLGDVGAADYGHLKNSRQPMFAICLTTLSGGCERNCAPVRKAMCLLHSAVG
jgi:hypothetical protein